MEAELMQSVIFLKPKGTSISGDAGTDDPKPHGKNRGGQESTDPQVKGRQRQRQGRKRRREVWSTTCHVRKTKRWWQIFERSTRAAIWGHYFKSPLCMQVSKGCKVCHHLISTCPRATCWTRSCSSWCGRIGATPSCERAERAEQRSEGWHGGICSAISVVSFWKLPKALVSCLIGLKID